MSLAERAPVSLRRIGPILLALAGALVLVILFAAKFQDKMRDFEVYWQAGARALAAEPLYRPEDGHYQFKYLPIFAVLMSPLAALPLSAAKALWFVGSVALLVTLLRLSLVLVPEPRWPRWALAAVTIVTLGKFYGHELVLGQTNIFMAVVALLGVAALAAGREARAGALLGLSVAVKPYAVLFLPYLAARRGRLAVLTFSGTLLAGLVVPAVWYGWSGNVQLLLAWYQTVTASTPSTLLSQDNVSILSMYAKWLGPGWLATGLTGATAVALGAAAVRVLSRRQGLVFPEYLEIAFLLTLVPLLSPQGWDYVLLLSTPAVVCLANGFHRLSRLQRAMLAATFFTIGFSLFDLMGRAAYAAFMSRSIITVCFLIVLALLLRLRLEAVT